MKIVRQFTPSSAPRVGWQLMPVCIASLLAGCAGGVAKIEPAESITSNSDALAQVDLITLLDPETKRNEPTKGATSRQESGTTRSLEAALNAFYRYKPQPPQSGSQEDFLKFRRNSVQDRLIAASNFECGRYKTRLLDVQSSTNFGLTTLSTGLAAAGAIVSGGASQVLSGTAAFTNATRSAFNENYFRQLAIETITSSIDARRTEFIAEVTERRALTISQYTVEYAIGDALKYHNQCTLIAGLEFAGDAVSFANDPPIRRTMVQLRNSGIEGDLTLDPSNARTVQGALTRKLEGVSSLEDAREEVNPDRQLSDEERVEGAETDTEKQLTVDDVKALQRKLCFKGDAVDAHFGPNTRTAIGQFQDNSGITGANVRRKFLNEITLAEIRKLSDCEPEFFSYYERRIYSNEDNKKALLAALGVDQSKQLNDKDVRDAIRRKQRELGLRQTGIIDTQEIDEEIRPAAEEDLQG